MMGAENKKIISILMVGRIYEEEDVFRLIQIAAATFAKKSRPHFYFNDAKTLMKISTKHPEYASFEFKYKQHKHCIDYIVTIGGDGTILYAAKDFVEDVPPLISFQRGSLGFMCRFRQDEIVDVINKTVSSHLGQIQFPFEKSSLMRLQATKYSTSEPDTIKSTRVCINEIYISRKGQERIALQISVNNEYLTHTAGDGILISTPTGSTAYSLSAGGPILQNGVNGIMIVPIAPNSLSFRPICFPSNCEIKIKLHKFSRSTAIVSHDGQTTEAFDFQHQLIIRRAPHEIIFFEPKKGQIQMPTWIQRLKFFLGWNEKYKSPEQYTPEINTHINKKECIEDD